MNETRTVSLPANLCARAEKMFGDRFGNLEQLLEYILRDMVSDAAEQADEAEQRILEQRLRELGYL